MEENEKKNGQDERMKTTVYGKKKDEGRRKT